MLGQGLFLKEKRLEVETLINHSFEVRKNCTMFFTMFVSITEFIYTVRTAGYKNNKNPVFTKENV